MTQRELVQKLKKITCDKGFMYVAHELKYDSESAVRQWVYREKVAHREVQNLIKLLKKEGYINE